MPQIMHDSHVLRVDPASVVHETLDGETILIHLASGAYFSLTGSGPAVWDLLIAGRPLGATVAAVGGDDPEARAAVRTFIDALLAEDLLVPAEGTSEVAAVSAQATGEFVTPVLARYDDMEYLLLLDPIHEASDNGWPSVQPLPQSAQPDGSPA